MGDNPVNMSKKKEKNQVIDWFNILLFDFALVSVEDAKFSLFRSRKDVHLYLFLENCKRNVTFI